MVSKLFSILGYSVYRNSVLSGFSLIENSEIHHMERLTRTGILSELLSQSDLTTNLPLGEAMKIIQTSKSQLGQDVLALAQTGAKKPGFFVEFGATNGIDLSNTYLLEKNFGWKGILCEPAKNWHNDLLANREAIIDTRCVFTSSGGNLEFSESTDGELSTLSDFVESDSHQRLLSRTYLVTTVTLKDLLHEHKAPKFIDFLSIDTEGSEYLILRDFDFETYRFGLICVEHNYTENREKINGLLSEKGYRRVLEHLSMWDDWYVSA